MSLCQSAGASINSTGCSSFLKCDACGRWVAARLALGLRITYVTAAMLSRTVPKGQPTLQLLLFEHLP